jgi:hypothetical protein
MLYIHEISKKLDHTKTPKALTQEAARELQYEGTDYSITSDNG